ncbi:MAG: ABC transporter permease [Thermoguttaceae bacterium]|jgi:putative ABC transport system permease protein
MTLRLLFAEIRYRKLNFVLGLVAVMIAVTLFVAAPTLVDGYRQETHTQLVQWEKQVVELEDGVARLRVSVGQFEKQMADELAQMEKETKRLMRDMGFNLMIVHRDTNMSDFWAADFAAYDMPQEYVERLAKDPRLTLVTHLVATLQARVSWDNRKVLLVGYLPETPQAHSGEKRPMGYKVEPGTVLVGHELGVGHKVGETIQILDQPFRIARILPEQGSKEDITLALPLKDAQSLLDKPGRINQIMALGCQCHGARLAGIRQQLAEVLPETRITEFRSIALARAEQRTLVEAKQKELLEQMQRNLQSREQILSERKRVLADMAASRARIQRVMETLAEVITPLVVLASAVWVGLMALANVRERRTEIGLLRALGKSSTMIASLFLGKAFLLGLAGAAFGMGLGSWTAYWFGQHALELAVEHLHVRYDLLFCALLGAPLVAMTASYLPTLAALVQDPAVVLHEA